MHNVMGVYRSLQCFRAMCTNYTAPILTGPLQYQHCLSYHVQELPEHFRYDKYSILENYGSDSVKLTAANDA